VGRCLVLSTDGNGFVLDGGSWGAAQGQVGDDLNLFNGDADCLGIRLVHGLVVGVVLWISDHFKIKEASCEFC